MCWMCYVVISHGPVLHTVLCTVSSHPCALHITCARAVVAVVLHAVAGRLDGAGEGLTPGPGARDPRHRPRQHRGAAVVVVVVEVAAHIPPQRTVIVIVN